MWIIALISLCQALAAESSSSVIKWNITNPNIMEDETTVPTYFIGDGKGAKDGQFPWAVALYLNGTYTCSATILSERIVLTAAHCVFNRDTNDFIGYVGSANKSSSAIHIEFENIRIHPKYNKSASVDIAVLKTKKRINFTTNMNKICIASEKIKGRGYQNLTAMGWGRLGESGEAGGSDILQYLEMECLDNHECSHNSSLKEPFIRARTIEGEICDGDSGGSLVEYSRKKKAVLVGVTSRTIVYSKESMGVTPDKKFKKCSNTGMFVRVSLHNDFIKKASGKDHGICIMSD